MFIQTSCATLLTFKKNFITTSKGLEFVVCVHQNANFLEVLTFQGNNDLFFSPDLELWDETLIIDGCLVMNFWC